MFTHAFIVKDNRIINYFIGIKDIKGVHMHFLFIYFIMYKLK